MLTMNIKDEILILRKRLLFFLFIMFMLKDALLLTEKGNREKNCQYHGKSY